MISVDNLNPYIRKKVFDNALIWRNRNIYTVIYLVGGVDFDKACYPPTGLILFNPDQWNGYHWVWFTLEDLLKGS